MIPRQITNKELEELLTRLGFIVSTIENRWRAYRHAASDTLILLTNRNGELPARDLDLISVRRHLVDNDLINEDEFEGFLVQDHR